MLATRPLLSFSQGPQGVSLPTPLESIHSTKVSQGAPRNARVLAVVGKEADEATALTPLPLQSRR